jgi:putative transposase
MPNYRCAFVRGGCWFSTVNLLDRRQWLLVEHIAALRASVAATRRDYPFTVDAFLVLPDHLHAVWTLPESDADFSTRWRLIKTRFGRIRRFTEMSRPDCFLRIGPEIAAQTVTLANVRERRERSADYAFG